MPPTGVLKIIGSTVHYTGKCCYCNKNFQTAWEWTHCQHITCDFCQISHNRCIMCKDPERKLSNDNFPGFLLIIFIFIYLVEVFE